jgi:SAM-dependent methyltransferase
LSTNPQNIKQQSKAMWALGSYGDVANYLLPMSAHLVKTANIHSGDSVLDVACGTGITTITARKQGAKVTGLDLTPELLTRAKQEAALAEAYGIEWKEGDAEDLPFEDNSFDATLSSVGHMFAPRPEVCASELVRVTKPGGRIAFSTWPPELAVGNMFVAMSKYTQQPPNPPPSPLLWGIPDIIKERLGSNVKDIHFERGFVNVTILSLNHYWQYMSTKFGPVIRTIQIHEADNNKLESLKNDFKKALSGYYGDNTLRLDYLVTVALKL